MDMNKERKIIEKMVGKAGLRGKVNAMCRWCSYDPLGSGTWLEQVKNCAVSDCPLYSVRPLPRGAKNGR